ncbi:uncharacterized protein LOC112520203 [Cynara cardunculus var. scolymus]|uniref:uncharacterized protein LOC112520203 n=1 Tax=Cynara cardunculus var. scolymus TaxID=59895 RepID=UPI000D62D473|nr:uncharacterized protein LOC112520203 [Cynara cardunculus var. scolymus]
MSSPFSFQDYYVHLQIPLQDIASATNNFAIENLVGKGEFGKFYKGQLILRSGHESLINIVARRLDRSNGGRHEYIKDQFWTEISMLFRLKHQNLVSFVGFCDEDGEKIVITKYAVNGSLDKYLNSPTLTWMQRLRICVDAARALNYIHYDTRHNFRVIHRNIKSSTILLDENWDARLSGFELSTATRRQRFVLSPVCGTFGYLDPVHTETGSVTQKSDVYAFGVVLFEVLCGRKAQIYSKDNRPEYLAPLATKHYEDKSLDEIIDPDLRKQMDRQSLSIFSHTAYQCLNRQRAQRPNMEDVVKTLEKASQLQWKHENPGENLEHLKIQLKDIVLATENFADTYCIGSGAYGMVYIAELDHFDSKSWSAREWKNKDELPKKRSSVAIKKIISRQDGEGEQGFFAEIEMLTSCKHKNIVSLLGFCDEGPHLILVYELASNGSLDDFLGNTNNITTLLWKQRIKVCLGIACGLNYLHTTMDDKERIIHCDIKSGNILLYENWEAKIADFGLSRFHPASTVNTNNIAGTEVYLDPEYLKTGKLKKESDTYSFGVVMFELLCGRLAYDAIYNTDNDKGLPSIVRQRFSEGICMDMVDPKIKEETDDNIFTLNRGPNQNSLDTFSKIAYQCLAETQAERPTMEAVIKELEKALYFQENNKDNLKISLEAIKLATQNFSDSNCIGGGGFGKAYKGQVPHGNGHNIIVAKRLKGRYGYCDEMNEKIIVYEYTTRGSLDRYLNDDGLMWMKRLEICIDVARGLDFLHETSIVKQEVVIHRDIKSSNILLNWDWKAKITDFGLSLICPMYQEVDYLMEHVTGTVGYVDPLYMDTGFLTKESDIYSFGVVLFEILCGRLAFIQHRDNNPQFLARLVKDKLDKGRVEEMVFEGIKKQIVPESLTTFCKIAYQCLHDDREKRPTAREVILQLEKALEFQEDYEVWEPKLPADYKQIIQMSKSSEIYSDKMKKDIYDMFSQGILVQEGKVWFSFHGHGERNELISARMFSYKNRKSYKWRSVPKSRFQVVAKMLDISNLKIQVQIKTQFLSPNVVYGVHLIFKFCDSRKISNKPMYVNLKYKMESETLHTYFATLRKDTWMMIELGRFLNHKEGIDLEVLLESFSSYYCGSGAIYVEGIEFQAVDNVRHEDNEKLREVQGVLTSKLWLSKVDGKKCHMLPAKDVLYDSSNDKFFNWKPSTESRFQEVIEVLPRQVFGIKCKIESQMLSPNTDYVCYLVFKLSERCRGLHCPVKVRNLLHRKNKEIGIVYFRFPSLWNILDTDRVPRRREDGWMEVNVWKFNSNDGIRHDSIPVNLKLISYEETMSGLVVCGLEIRPM